MKMQFWPLLDCDCKCKNGFGVMTERQILLLNKMIDAYINVEEIQVGLTGLILEKLLNLFRISPLLFMIIYQYSIFPIRNLEFLE